MGLMRFVVTPPDRISEDAFRQVYMSGIDRVAWRAEVAMTAGQLVVRRGVAESGNLHVPWPTERHGTLTLATGCLMERTEPYHLSLELARGTIGQLTQQLARWREAGLTMPERVTEAVADAIRCFGQAALGQEDLPESAKLAEQAIGIALDAADLLVAAYADQTAAARRHADPRPPLLLAGNLGSALPDDSTTRTLVRCFNAAVVPLGWREIEPSQEDYRWTSCGQQVDWCRSHGLTICGGPLPRLDSQGVPDWIYLYEDDFDSLVSFVTNYVRAVVSRYRGKVGLWQCAGSVATSGVVTLSEEERLRLAASVLGAVRLVDPQTPALLTFDQPWGECLARGASDLPPLYFADALVRAGVEVAGLVLEIDLGYCPGGTLPRSPLEFSRQLDHWSLLGLPLLVSLRVPSAEGDDPLAQSGAKVLPGQWTPETQRAWVARYVPLILSKPLVCGVVWNQLHDGRPHALPHGGLFEPDGRPKPAFDALSAIRRVHQI